MPKKLKKPALVLLLGILIAAAAWGSYFIWLRDDKSKEEQTYQPSELSVPTDYYAPSVDEIKAQFKDPTDQYNQLLQYAYAKETVKKYDEAIVLYEAAIDVASNDESKKAAQYTLYRLGFSIQRPELSEKYKQLLGEEWIKQHEQAEMDRRRDE